VALRIIHICATEAVGTSHSELESSSKALLCNVPATISFIACTRELEWRRTLRAHRAFAEIAIKTPDTEKGIVKGMGMGHPQQVTYTSHIMSVTSSSAATAAGTGCKTA